MCLGANIRYLRNKKGFSQEYVANKLGYKSFTTIQKWESGVSEPPIRKLKELAILFDADISEMNSVLLDDSDHFDNNISEKCNPYYNKLKKLNLTSVEWEQVLQYAEFIKQQSIDKSSLSKKTG